MLPSAATTRIPAEVTAAMTSSWPSSWSVAVRGWGASVAGAGDSALGGFEGRDVSSDWVVHATRATTIAATVVRRVRVTALRTSTRP